MAIDSKTRKRFSKSAWTELGLSLLRKHGPTALTVEELCENAQKTRGSFYFHFETVDAFLEALAKQWQIQFTDEIVKTSPPSESRLDCLNLLAIRIDLDLERYIRELALKQKQVNTIVMQADTARIAWLAELYANSGQYAQQDAENLAKIEYAAFVGFKLVDPDMSAPESRSIYEGFLKLTGRL
ncbi:MAG: TetR/AcrR family transcriptional regulator [Pseudomonadota bacterium]